MSINVLPAVAADDLSNMSATEAEVLSDDSLQNAGCGLIFDLSGDGLCDLGSGMTLPSSEPFRVKVRGVSIAPQQPFWMLARETAITRRVAPFGHHIVQVGFLSANPKVATARVQYAVDLIRPLIIVSDAAANVTHVTDQQAIRDGTGNLLPSDLMGAVSHAAESKNAVPPIGEVARPRPTWAVLGPVTRGGPSMVNVERESLNESCRKSGAPGRVQAIASSAAIEADAESDLLSRGKEAGPAQAADARRGTLDGHRDHSSVSAPGVGASRGHLLHGLYHE